MIMQITTAPYAGKRLGCSGGAVSRIFNITLLVLLAILLCFYGVFFFNILKQVHWGLMEEKRGLARKSKLMQELF